ncbi:sigma-70 family RNA polymerase sigma factor [Tamlana sp. 2201CG12-4]|uniref:RNA polymerase sigma factor n=1 Tax=Tamlana sp. 2201CG12-4 TaxID=3112582 RepID=UPI002DB9009A|nr:sigma-70 family RNA polymerase sigma factor [Tamlana sp. 2201CG12-4]MEC3908583.1 sigma-70 family RNA polymerase sigma factor [Tamlana sp. 2201CG12-4]
MRKKQQLINKHLVIDYQSGKLEALPLLVKRWHKYFCEKAFWIVKDPDVAKDIAQESWTVIINKIENLKKPECFGSWASRIVYTKSLDWINTNKRLQKSLETYKQEQVNIENEGDDEDNIKIKLLEAIKTLPDAQQVVIKLFYVEDYSLKEIGEILNISVGTAKSRLFHAREKLKQILKIRNYEN